MANSIEAEEAAKQKYMDAMQGWADADDKIYELLRESRLLKEENMKLKAMKG